MNPAPIKPWYTSKTVWTNLVALAISVLELVADSPLLTTESASLLGVVSVLNLVWRWLTDEPITSLVPELDPLRRKVVRPNRDKPARRLLRSNHRL